jgi:hypothetical protein
VDRDLVLAMAAELRNIVRDPSSHIDRTAILETS